MQVLVLGKRVIIEKAGKSKTDSQSLFSIPEDMSAVGYVKYVSPTVLHLRPGMKVYYGKNRHELKMNGSDVLVMDEDNVYAIVEEDGAEDKQKASS